MPLTTPPKTVSFLGAPVVCDPAEVQARFAFLGMPFGVPYDMEGIAPRSSGGPDAVRAATRGFYGEHDRYDFDLGGPMSADGWLSLVDCGNVAGDPYSVAGYAARATNYVHDLVAAGATPLVVGGDHSIPPLVVGGLDRRRELNILQIDAHLDYLEERDGVKAGYSSSVRRLRELPFVRDIIQVGLRGPGTARAREVDEAVAAGNILITADQVHEESVYVVLDRLRDGAAYYITVDLDGLDPGCAPAVAWPLPGGLMFTQVAAILRAVARRCDIAGVDFCELIPEIDVNGLTALAVMRLLMNVIGVTAARERA